MNDLGKSLKIIITTNLLFLSGFIFAQDAEPETLFNIGLNGQARFVLGHPDGNQYGATYGEPISSDNKFNELFSAKSQNLQMDIVDDGQYRLTFDAVRTREFELIVSKYDQNGYTEYRTDYFYNPLDQNNVTFEIIDGAIIAGPEFSYPQNFKTIKNSGIFLDKTALQWDAVLDASEYIIYYKPDTFPFYRQLARVSDNSYQTDIPWATFSDPDFPKNLNQFTVSAVLISGNKTVMSLPVKNDDIDGDGFSDYREIQMGIDPEESDTDSDGLDDFIEINRSGTDPLLSDSDGDGFSDADEFIAGTAGLDPESKPPMPQGTCSAPGVGNWIITTWCIITENQFVDQNLLLLKGAYLQVKSGVKIFLDFTQYNIHMHSGSDIDLDDNAGVIQAER